MCVCALAVLDEGLPLQDLGQMPPRPSGEPETQATAHRKLLNDGSGSFAIGVERWVHLSDGQTLL